MSEEPNLIRNLAFQAEACRRLGSPFNGELLDRAKADTLAGGPAAALFEPWKDAGLRELFDAAPPLRFTGALHDLALSGEDPALAAAYRRLDPEAAWTAARQAMVRERERLARFMTHEPQTNEVRRCVCLAPGFLEVAKATGLPLRAFELGASAGLNLSWDQYRYAFGDANWGEAAAPVSIDTDWEGSPPPVDAAVEVVERAACDRRPVSLADPAQRRRLLAYVWPDQGERLARARAAIELALSREVVVEEGDASAWTRGRVTTAAGAATVLYHSVFWQYMPADSQADLSAAIEAIGATATSNAPFAWLRMEPAPENMASMEVRLTLWPNGETRILAEVHPHGAWVKWKGSKSAS